MTQPKKLIEVAMPIKEISAESVRDKSIRHGHISTLHLWWARRPLPVCRAVVFASLVPDPLDENCPQAFRDAVEILLGAKNNLGDPYKPYDNIPYTAAVDPMEDNLRNRLLMFIGKFSDTYIQKGESTPAKDKLSNASLIKWDNKNDEEIIGKARKLIWVAHNSRQSSVSSKQLSAEELLADFDKHYQAIKTAENDLYSMVDRHLESDEVKAKEANLQRAIEAFLDKMPRVFDPFAGGGAIPLEAARLGCRSFGNDINPVAYIIQKGSLEFPQKYGKPIVYSRQEFIRLYGEDELKRIEAENSLYANSDKVKIENRLAFDVEFYARQLLKRAEDEIGHFYPASEESGNPQSASSNPESKKPIAYYWARVATCSNPSCRAEVPLLKQFYLANTKNKQVYLKPIIDGNKIDFEIKKGKFDAEGWMSRGNLKCPCCGNPTDVNTLKKQFKNGETGERMLAVIWDGTNGKEYRKPSEKDLAVIAQIPADIERPSEAMPVTYTQALPSCTWGLERWGDMFSPRQLLAMQTLVQKLNEIKKEIGIENGYGQAVVTYLGILIDRIVSSNNKFCRWRLHEAIDSPFAKQAIPMLFDYPEGNIFSKSTGSALNQLQWLRIYIESESGSSFSTNLQNASSGAKEQFPEKSITAVVTDPPYCLTAGTLILTESGYRPIEEIKVGERVLSHKGRFVRVTQTFERDYDGDLWRVFVTGANRPLEITPEHPIYAMKTTGCHYNFRYCRPTCSYLAQQGHCRHQQFENYQAEWICPTDLKEFDLIGFPILQTQTRPKSLRLSDILDDDKYTLSDDVLHYEKFSPIILNRLGLLTGYYHERKERVSIINGNKVFGSQKFALNVNGESLCRMAKKIGLPENHDISRKFTGQRGYSDGKTIWRPIRKIEKTAFRGKVYNLETEDHSYTTFAGCVHNCDAIAYADLSDFFYVWLKRTLGDVYPANFATPQTPKTEECTALKHHHDGDVKKANKHFENKLLEIFSAIEHQTADTVSIMFAHQSTYAWTILCNSILGAGMNITGSWAIDTEMTNRSLALAGAALASSVTVACKPANRSGFGDYKEVKRAIEKRVEEEVAELYALGFRGADLLTACFGKAVSEFGKYEKVEKADGSEVTVAELLEMTREAAFNALLKGFKGDDFTKFYIGWLELYGFTESDFDDAAKFTRIGLSINVADLFANEIFVKNGNKQSLADYVYRNEKKKHLGEQPDAPLIDRAHKAMWLYKSGNRSALLNYIGRFAASPDDAFWRVLTSLDELLPKGSDNQKQVQGLLTNKDNLIRESREMTETVKQQELFE